MVKMKKTKIKLLRTLKTQRNASVLVQVEVVLVVAAAVAGVWASVAEEGESPVWASGCEARFVARMRGMLFRFLK